MKTEAARPDWRSANVCVCVWERESVCVASRMARLTERERERVCVCVRAWKEPLHMRKETYMNENRSSSSRLSGAVGRESDEGRFTLVQRDPRIWIKTYIYEKRPTYVAKRPTYMKRELRVWIESYSYEKRPGAVVGNSDVQHFTHVKRDLYVWKETYLHDK